jgi:hypothetical protein
MKLAYGPYVDVRWSGPTSGEGEFQSLSQLACDQDTNPNLVIDIKRIETGRGQGRKIEFEAKGKKFDKEDDAVKEHQK